MEDIKRCKTEISKQVTIIKKPLLMLDFDGVLSAIAPTPDEAFISDNTVSLLKKCGELFPVAIITGRDLAEIKKKIDVKNILYIASHGLEWEEDGKYYAKPIPREVSEAINLAKEEIKLLIENYPGMVFEDKPFTFAVHYRIMDPGLVKDFIKKVKSILKPIAEQYKLRLDHNLKTFELRPEINWDKGDSALFIEKHFNKKIGKKLIPIYIGDSLTDEDAFVALKENGITIRVGRSKKSAAKYYIKNQKQVDSFLEWLVREQA